MAEEHNSAGREGDSIADESAATETSPTELESRLTFMFSLWHQMRNGKGLPERSDLDPTLFHRLWPIAFLLERVSEGCPDWRVRFAGSAYGAVYGREVTGARVSEIISEELAPQVLADFRNCAENATPVINTGATTWPEQGNVYYYQRLLLPFGTTEPAEGENRQKVTHLLGVAAFFNSAGSTIF